MKNCLFFKKIKIYSKKSGLNFNELKIKLIVFFELHEVCVNKFVNRY